MRGIYYFITLTDEVKDKFIRNYNATDNIPLEEYLRNEYDSLYDFIAYSFSWGNTPEGFHYWDVISERIKPVNKKPVNKKQVFKMTPLKFI